MTRPKGSKNKPKDFSKIPSDQQMRDRDKSIYPSMNSPVSIKGFAESVAASFEQPIVHTHTIAPVIERRKEIRYDAIFAVRFLRKDSAFPGLWELVKLDQNMNRVKVITDANAKGQVQVLLMREVKRLVAIP